MQYETQTDDLKSELVIISTTYSNNFKRALWQFNKAQTQDMLDNIVQSSIIDTAIIKGGAVELSAGELSTDNTIQKEGDIYFQFNNNDYYLGTLEIYASLQNIYHNLYNLAISRLLINFTKSIIVLSFSFIAFQTLVNRHLIYISKRIEDGVLLKPKHQPFHLIRHPFAYVNGDELDKVTSTLNNLHSELNSQFRMTKKAYQIRNEEGKQHLRNLEAINQILFSNRQYISYFNKDSTPALICDNDFLENRNIKKLLSIMHLDSKSVKVMAENLGLKCRYITPKKQEQKQYDLELEDENGIYWRFTSVIFLNGSIGMLCADITKVKQLESELIQTQKLESLGTLTGGIAHDFNNILATILSNLEMLKLKNTIVELNSLADNAIEACQKGESLTHSLLSFARKSEINQELINLNMIIDKTLQWSMRTIPENIKIDFVQGTGIWSIETDLSQTENSLLNLILNARDAMPNGGKLTIETANIHIDDDYIWERNEKIEPGRYVILAVSDTGIGIPEKHLNKIFEPFYTTKKHGKGSGIGLSRVHGFLKQTNGTIRVYTEENIGTTFKLYFPASNKSAYSEIEPVKKTIGNTMGAHILLIEDNDSIRVIFIEILNHAGYRVTSAPDGEQAIELFKSLYDVDLILADMVLPGKLNGPATIHEIRKTKPNICVIYMSGYAQNATIYDNELKTDDIWLTKPIDRKTLVGAIEKSLARISLGGKNYPAAEQRGIE